MTSRKFMNVFEDKKDQYFFSLLQKTIPCSFFVFTKFVFRENLKVTCHFFRLGLGKEFPNYRKDLKSGLSQVSFQLFIVLNVLVLHLDSEHFK